MLMPRNAHGNDAWFIEFLDKKNAYLHQAKRQRNGDIIYTLREGYIGAAVFRKADADKLIKQMSKDFPNMRAVAVKDVVGTGDGSCN